MTIETTILHTCRNIPCEPAKKISLVHLVEEIQRILNGKADIVWIHGEPLSGKSQLAAELFLANPTNSIGLFLESDDVFRSKQFVQLSIAEQISWIVDAKPYDADAISEEDYRRLLYRLQRHARSSPIYWVVDGISVSEDLELLKSLPINQREFRFTFTCESIPLDLSEITNRNTKGVSTPTISLDEARSYLGDLLKEEHDIKEIRSLCCGSIGRMSKIRALLQDGFELERIFDFPPKSLDDLLELEWKRISDDSILHNLLAELAYLATPVRASDFCVRASLSWPDLFEKIKTAKILSISSQGNEQYITFSSSIQKKFAARKLKALEQVTRDQAIARLLGRPDDKFTAKYLPSELEIAGRHAELVSHLTPEHFARLLKSERTFRAIRHQAEMGRQAAQRIDQIGAELGFGIISSAVTGLSISQGSAEQIGALSRLSTPEHALELAATAPTVEERLHLLTKAASILHKKGLSIPDRVKDQIKFLAPEVDLLTLGDIAVEIATDLLAIESKFAIEFFSRITASRRQAQETSLDQRIGGIGETNGSKSASPELARSGTTELPEHLTHRFWHEASKHIERRPADSFISSLRKEEAGIALIFAKRWLQGNRGNSESYKVVDTALDLLLADNSTTPQIHDLRELADALPSIKDEVQADLLTNRIFTQFRALGHHGISAESVRLRMQVFCVKYRKASKDTELDLIELFVEIQGLPDISARATCWAWMLHGLTFFSNHSTLENNTELNKLVSQELENTISQLLNSAADHFSASKNAIIAIARRDARKAFVLVSSLNTEVSRNKGYTALIRSLEHSHESEYPVIVDALRAISTPELRSEAIVDTLMSIRARYAGKRLDGQKIVIAQNLLETWKEVELASFKFQAATVALISAIESNSQVQAEQINSQMKDIWESTITDGVRIQLGHLAASELADTDSTLAKEWMNKAQTLSIESNQATDGISEALHSTLHLCTRLFPSIHPVGKPLAGDETFSRFAHLASEITSIQLRIQLWTSLAVRMYFCGDIAAAKYICDHFVSNVLDCEFSSNAALHTRLIVNAAPILYLTHANSAIARIEKLPATLDRDRARSNIITTLLQRTHHSDQFNSSKPNEFTLEPTICTDILQIIKDIHCDSIIHGVVEDFCRSLVAKVNLVKLRRNFVIDILKSLENAIKPNLPDANNIRHEGFLIACEATILRARIDIQNNNSSLPWDSLYARARGINNVADRVVVTAMVWVKSKCKAGGRIDDWLSDIKSDMPIIPSALDRMDRYEWIAKIVEPRDGAAARAFLREGLKVSTYVPHNSDVIKNKRQLLDFAFAIDSALANELVEKFDTDEASKAMHSRRFKAIDMRKDLASKPDEIDLSSLPDHKLIEICTDNLGSLAAHRINARPLVEFRPLICRAMNIPVRDARPIWELIVENTVKKLGAHSQNHEISLSIFRSVFRAAELSHALIEKAKATTNFGSEALRGTVGAGERDLFLTQMAQWAATQDGEYIYISDPYFSPADLDFLRTLSEAAPNAKFKIATSKETMRAKKIDSPEDGFYDHWKSHFDMNPPEVEIAVVGFGQEGKHPIHDRWIMSNHGGMRLGTSIGSLGLARISELSEIDPLDLPEKLEQVSTYFFASPPKTFNGERLSVVRFSL